MLDDPLSIVQQSGVTDTGDMDILRNEAVPTPREVLTPTSYF